MSELQKEKKHKLRRIIILLGILIIPLLYSFFYLKAFWAPYKTLKDVKVGDVNLDQGAIIKNEKRNIENETNKV